MKSWVRFLPFFIVVIIAKRYGEKFNVEFNGKTNKVIVCPFKGIYIQVLVDEA
tara:strand:- start:45 stop:203 length:159 start_codon:yes stop_codon:yes gene_type:complete